jgi:hypothetical protein
VLFWDIWRALNSRGTTILLSESMPTFEELKTRHSTDLFAMLPGFVERLNGWT